MHDHEVLSPDLTGLSLSNVSWKKLNQAANITTLVQTFTFMIRSYNFLPLVLYQPEGREPLGI